MPKFSNKLIAVLAAVSVLSGMAAYFTRSKFGGPTVCRGGTAISAKQTVIIESAGLPVIISACDGEEIIVEYASELPVNFIESEGEVRIIQDDGFAVSLFVWDALSYYIKVSLPVWYEYKKIKATTAGGDISIDCDRLVLDDVELTTKNGGIDVVSANAALNLFTYTGSVSVDYADFLLPTIMESVAGDITVSFPEYCAVGLDFVTESGSVTSGKFFPREYNGYKGVLFAQRGDNPEKLFVKTKSADLLIKEKNTDAIGDNSGV